MRLVFHLGVHKTASTLIQKNLADNVDWLRGQGVYYVNSELPQAIIRQREHLRRFQSPTREAPPADGLRKLNRRILREAAFKNAHTILISEENRLGAPIYHRMPEDGSGAAFYPKATECLTRTLAGFADTPTTLIMVERDFPSLLPSLYSEALTNLETTDDIDAFCRRIDFGSLDYEALRDRIDQAAPWADLRRMDFAQIKGGAGAYLSKFLTLAGVPTKGFSVSTDSARNSVDRDQAEALRKLAEVRAKTGDTPRAERLEILRKQADPDRRIRLPDWVADALAQTVDAAPVSD